ncbi:hypothetical protein AB0M47_32390 [Hamadaea sp. NPDC051192]|uniref:hypothetical protein n=1 Tax=Hamadaea sp. NPDC051192 TaxID=3154940 RepID=UPI00341D6BE7
MSFLNPDLVTFELRDGEPVLSLAVEVPTGPDEGWSLMNRLTVCVVDGPGDAGYLFPRLGGPAGDKAPQGWDEAVARAGGSTVVFGGGTQTRTLFAPSVG